MIFPFLETFGEKHASFSCPVEYVEACWMALQKTCFFSCHVEYVNMLTVLGTYRPHFGEKSHRIIQKWQFRTIFPFLRPSETNMLLSAVPFNMLKHVEWHCASFSCHIEYAEYVECLGNYQGLVLGEGAKFQIIPHIQHDSWKKLFWGEGIQHDSTYSTWQLKEGVLVCPPPTHPKRGIFDSG